MRAQASVASSAAAVTKPTRSEASPVRSSFALSIDHQGLICMGRGVDDLYKESLASALRAIRMSALHGVEFAHPTPQLPVGKGKADSGFAHSQRVSNACRATQLRRRT
jgi:hypothetical protein